MRPRAATSWRTVGLLATGWLLACLVALMIAASLTLHELRSSSATASGGIAALGVGISKLGALIIVAPPLLLIVLRLLVGGHERDGQQSS